MATVAVAATSQQLGTHRPLLVLPDGAAGFDNGAFAQRPAMPAGSVSQPAAAAAPTALSAHGEAAARGEAWMRQSSQLPQRFNGPMFVTDAVSGKMVPIPPMRGAAPHMPLGGGDNQAAGPMMMIAPGQAGAAQMMYCAAPTMVSMAPPPTPVRVVCRGCGLVRMEVEGAPRQ